MKELREVKIIIDEFEKRLHEIIKNEEVVSEFEDNGLIKHIAVNFPNGALLTIEVINGNRKEKTPAYVDAVWHLGDDEFVGTIPEGLFGTYMLKGDENDSCYIAELIPKKAFYRFSVNDIVDLHGEFLEVEKVTDSYLLLSGGDRPDITIWEEDLEILKLVCKAEKREDI